MATHTEYLTGTSSEFAPKEEGMVTLSIPATQAEIATLSERLINDNPSVQKVLDATSQVYNVAKNYNGLTRYSLEKIESPVQAAYVASQAPLKRIDQYAGNVVDRAGEAYNNSKADLNRRVVEPVTKASDNILTSAERAVDSYLPDTRQRSSPSSESNANQRDRAVNLGRTLIERVQERAYRLYLLVASVTLFLVAQSILLTVEVGRDVALFTLTTGLRLVKAPRETSLELLDRAQRGVYYAIYLALHPVELLTIVYDRYRRIQQRIAENNNNHKKTE
eukprot:TRINITY_DN2909_c0_g1_i1.p1 TRINITY_DN2909_c0_g1~~TRINITY_DN2909_c0_g1_i1.p1  ORF type:complete len:278 (-),score=68.22 TRINITY_DN2909_c0_g1_i1:27-860(-)